MGIFDELGEFDIADAPDNPFDLEDGVYEGVVAEFKPTVGKRQDGSEYKGLTATLKPDDNIPYDYYMPLPADSDSDRVKGIKLSSIKRFLLGVGVPVDRLNTVTRDDVVDTRIQFKLTTGKPNAAGRTFRNVDVRTKGSSTMATAEAVSGGPVAGTPAAGSDDFNFEF